MKLKTRGQQAGLALATILATQTLWASSCSLEEIDQFLQRGFSHEQIVKLCGNQQPAAPAADSSPVPAAPSPAATNPPPQAGITQSATTVDKDIFYLQTVIDADKVEVTPEAIIYWRNKCFPYGAESYSGFRPEACVNMRSTLNRKGLKVVRAVKGILLIRDQEMIVGGTLKQDVLDPEKLKPKTLEDFIVDYPASPAELNIPVKKGIDPAGVAAALKRLTLK